MRNLLLLLVGVVLLAASTTGCSAPIVMDPVMGDDGRPEKVTIEHISSQCEWTGFMVQVRFSENTRWKGVIQECYLENGETLVEYFLLKGGVMPPFSCDCHAGPVLGQKVSRKMFVYPADVEDVDWFSECFAQLPCNKDKSVFTTITQHPRYFNPGYQLTRKTQGRVVSDAKHLGVWWSIYTDGRSVHVKLPE